MKIHNVLFMNQSVECDKVLSQANSYVESIAGNRAPTITEAWHSPTNAVVGDLITVASLAEDLDGDPLKMRMTFYGIPKEECKKATCGDFETEIYSVGGSASIHSAVTYQRAGRYIIRIEATDMKGNLATQVAP